MMTLEQIKAQTAEARLHANAAAMLALLRKFVVSHGVTKMHAESTQYVGCKCDKCEAARVIFKAISTTEGII